MALPVEQQTQVGSYEKILTIANRILHGGEITKEEYNQWRYRYPEFDTTQRWVKVPSQELTDWLFSDLKDKK